MRAASWASDEQSRPCLGRVRRPSPAGFWDARVGRGTVPDMERRDHRRVDFPVLVLIRTAPDAPHVSAYGRDLSELGLRVEGQTSVLGAIVGLLLVERGGGRGAVELLGQVTRIDDDGFSVRFVDLEPRQQAWLAEVVGARARGQVESGETEDLLAEDDSAGSSLP